MDQSQSINRSIDQSFDRSIDRSINRSISIHQSNNRSIHQLRNRSIDESFNNNQSKINRSINTTNTSHSNHSESIHYPSSFTCLEKAGVGSKYHCVTSSVNDGNCGIRSGVTCSNRETPPVESTAELPKGITVCLIDTHDRMGTMVSIFGGANMKSTLLQTILP